jgi:RimJ/RimL family protein N-acetyltransferase
MEEYPEGYYFERPVMQLKTSTVSDRELSLIPFQGESDEIEMWERLYDRKRSPETANMLMDPETHMMQPAETFIVNFVTYGIYAHYRIEHQEHGLIGFIGASLVQYDEPRHCYLSYAVNNKELWGKGIGTRAVSMMLHVLAGVGMDMVYADTILSNGSSQKVLQNNGFSQVSFRNSERLRFIYNFD